MKGIFYRYRAHAKAQAERDLTVAQRKELELRRLHVCILPPRGPHMCIVDNEYWPCRTIQILDGNNQNEAPVQTKRDSLLD